MSIPEHSICDGLPETLLRKVKSVECLVFHFDAPVLILQDCSTVGVADVSGKSTLDRASADLHSNNVPWDELVDDMVDLVVIWDVVATSWI